MFSFDVFNDKHIKVSTFRKMASLIQNIKKLNNH